MRTVKAADSLQIGASLQFPAAIGM